jgi:hypothetical protein
MIKKNSYQHKGIQKMYSKITEMEYCFIFHKVIHSLHVDNFIGDVVTVLSFNIIDHNLLP